jgi:hypothetical protein
MRLYEWRENINLQLIQFKYIGNKLNLPCLNSYFFRYTNNDGLVSRRYPLLKNQDIESLRNHGQCIVFNDDGIYIFVVDMDHYLQSERLSTLRDFKIRTTIEE